MTPAAVHALSTPVRVVSLVIDRILHFGLVAFALWTLLYELALATGVSLWTMVPIWLALCATALAAALFVRRRGRDGAVSESPTESRDRTTAPSRDRIGRTARIVLAVGLVSLAAIAFRHRASELMILVVVALALVIATLVVLRSSAAGQWQPTTAEPERRDVWQELVALTLAAGASVFSSLLLNTDADDAYYVNRSVWVAEHGSAALKDTIFGPATAEANYGAGIPIASIEGLLGAVAHWLQVSAGSVTYLVAVPLAAFFAVWSLWCLLRAWAPRRAALGLAVAVLFVLLSGSGVIGNYSFGRLWQGKVMAVTIVIPLIWLFAGRLLTQRRTSDLAYMFVLGVAFVGLTSTAVILAPVITGALLVAAAVLRSPRLAAGGLALLLAPLVSGVVVTVSSTQSAAPSEAPSGWGTLGIVLGWSPLLVTLAVVALVVLPLTARRGPLTVLAAAAGALPFAVLLPGVLPLANAVTGSGPVLWRLLLAVPVPLAVGLLATTDFGLSHRVLARACNALVVVGVSVALVLAGTPIWSADVGAVITSTPRWKVDPVAQPVAARIARTEVGRGPVLLPHAEMRVLPMTTTRMFALVPRKLYAEGFAEPRKDKAARFGLYRLVARQRPLLSRAETRAALRRLDVSLVCVNRRFTGVIGRVRAAGYRPERRIDRLVCLTPRADS